MAKTSAGIILYRKNKNTAELEFLLVHPGGPFWAKKDFGVWSIPKGELNHEENLLDAAKREFEEEIGFMPKGDFIELGSVVQKSGKTVYAWAIEGDFDVANLKSNMLRIEWPLKSGKFIEIPEVDKAEFFTLEQAKEKINPAQIEFLVRLENIVLPK